jgi:alkyl hydroperoxide reductase subunit AhpF
VDDDMIEIPAFSEGRGEADFYWAAPATGTNWASIRVKGGLEHDGEGGVEAVPECSSKRIADAVVTGGCEAGATSEVDAVGIASGVSAVETGDVVRDDGEA